MDYNFLSRHESREYYLIIFRFVINTERVVGEVAIDDCRYVDPCTRPNTCEHGGICSIREDRVICNCESTGMLLLL